MIFAPHENALHADERTAGDTDAASHGQIRMRFGANSEAQPVSESLDILLGLAMILDQKKAGRAAVENEYARVVTASGNRKARDVIGRVFEKCDAAWRGIGVLPGSGLAIRAEYAAFDAAVRFGVAIPAAEAATACRCGDVLKGKIAPDAYPLFGTACTPDAPVGPCMVSTEGTCAAQYKYGVQQ